MIIISTNTLTTEQYQEIQELIEPGTPVFLEADMNYYEEFPCFHFLYEDKKLTAFLSVFIPHEEECEIYAYTSPEKRGNGYFSILLKKARVLIEKYKISLTLLVSESETCPIISSLYSSDYILSYDFKNIPVPKGTLKLIKQTKDNIIIYETYKDDIYVGGCKCSPTGNSHMIYEFVIAENERRKGSGKETLLLVIKDLIKLKVNEIILHIYGSNEIAKKIYLENGFVVKRKINYWRLK